MARKPATKTRKADWATILHSVSDRTRLFALLALIFEGLFVVASTRLPTDKQFPAFIISTGVVVMALLFVFALELRFHGTLNQEIVPFAGEWRGRVSWTDEWAQSLWSVAPDSPHSEGEMCIYRSTGGVYKGFAMWTFKNGDTPYAVAATLMSNFNFTTEGGLSSLDIKAYARRSIAPDAPYGPSPIYTMHFKEINTTKLFGRLTARIKSVDTDVGSVLIERV